MMCDCHSHNGEFGVRDEVAVRILTAIIDGERLYREVMIDACIAPVVQHLQENGVSTLGSCCGHGKGPPSLVLGSDVENYSEVRRFIKEKDDRLFELSQWKRVVV